MSVLGRGCVHVYTGNGKGKTTAALGLALRASGAGLKIYMQQFAKGRDCAGVRALRKLRNVSVGQCGNGPFVVGRPSISDIECARRGLEDAGKKIFSGRYDLVILDEINIAMKLGLVMTRDVTKILRARPKGVEIVLTGRGCPASVKKLADIVTDMREVRHPYSEGMVARRGIDY